MSSIPEPANGTGTRTRLRGDERGAIMVMGIFMCACMVGMLWYLAGIGDAIVYKQRMQSGADAVAFSGAVLHARGMNLIVMLNIIMAVVLAVRVILRAVIAILTALYIVFFALGKIPYPPTAAFFSALAEVVDGINKGVKQVEKATRQPIDKALEGLSTLERAVARVVPPLAIAGAFEVGTKYKPIVKEGAAVGLDALLNGLPVEEDTPDKLCREAGKAAAGLITWVPGLGSVKSQVEGMVGSIISAGGAYFCGIGSGGSPPDMSGVIANQTAQRCQQKREELENDVHEKEQALLDAQAAGPGPYDTEELELQAAQNELEQFEDSDCESDAQSTANSQNSNVDSPRSSNSSKMTPKKVKAGWQNGDDEAQIVGFTYGDDKSLKIAPRGVLAGAEKGKVQIKTPVTSKIAFAQAEFFYDCEGRWKTSNCNGTSDSDQQAMWNFFWRARLRRYNDPVANAEFLVELAAAGPAYATAIYELANSGTVNPNSVTYQNMLLNFELAAVVGGGDIIIH